MQGARCRGVGCRAHRDRRDERPSGDERGQCHRAGETSPEHETLPAQADEWFEQRPRTSRAEFCARVGLPEDRPYLVYACSSNFIAPDEMPYRSPSGIVWDSGRFGESLERACEAAGYPALREEQERARAAGRYLGVGVASYVELTGVGSAIAVSPGADIATGTEGVTVRVEPGGSVTAIFALASHGQGIETTLAQVVAGELGVPAASVRVRHGDTALGPHGTGSYASRARCWSSIARSNSSAW